MTAITITKNISHYNSRFSLVVEQILAFASRINLGTEIKNKFPNFKQVS